MAFISLILPLMRIAAYHRHSVMVITSESMGIFRAKLEPNHNMNPTNKIKAKFKGIDMNSAPEELAVSTHTSLSLFLRYLDSSVPWPASCTQLASRIFIVGPVPPPPTAFPFLDHPCNAETLSLCLVPAFSIVRPVRPLSLSLNTNRNLLRLKGKAERVSEPVLLGAWVLKQRHLVSLLCYLTPTILHYLFTQVAIVVPYDLSDNMTSFRFSHVYIGINLSRLRKGDFSSITSRGFRELDRRRRRRRKAIARPADSLLQQLKEAYFDPWYISPNTILISTNCFFTSSVAFSRSFSPFNSTNFFSRLEEPAVVKACLFSDLHRLQFLRADDIHQLCQLAQRRWDSTAKHSSHSAATALIDCFVSHVADRLSDVYRTFNVNQLEADLKAIAPGEQRPSPGQVLAPTCAIEKSRVCRFLRCCFRKTRGFRQFFGSRLNLTTFLKALTFVVRGRRNETFPLKLFVHGIKMRDLASSWFQQKVLSVEAKNHFQPENPQLLAHSLATGAVKIWWPRLVNLILYQFVVPIIRRSFYVATLAVSPGTLVFYRKVTLARILGKTCLVGQKYSTIIKRTEARLVLSYNGVRTTLLSQYGYALFAADK
eukprot:Gregarina_sp_Poly_1__6175@NODE_326_length_9503_cov_249_815388_g278_i0_p2_GENE_NODE_326_length_9503_cov_249_815388_g278_i0NODE_326_length_9503_cov_249_815388_g278_i0_p2_ORF_typecomplete_len597_score62_35Telomerase_RBD/PF12009_8/9_3e14_NODE_326_length_9503_cov_249_815388_g278_i019683758